MNFFSKTALIISTLIVSRRAFMNIKRAAEQAENAVEISECESLSVNWANGSLSMELCVSKIAKTLLAIGEPENAAAIQASGARAIGAMRVLSAYYFHTSQGKSMGELAIEQGLEIEKQWIAARPPFLNYKSANFAKNLCKLFDGLALSASMVSIRGEAERLSTQGLLGAAKAHELSDRVAKMASDAYAMNDSMNIVHDGERNAELITSRDKLRIQAAGRLNAPCEQAQILLAAGLNEQAKEILDAALDKKLPDERASALEGLAKELRPARGNNFEFIRWAKLTYASDLGLSPSFKTPALSS